MPKRLEKLFAVKIYKNCRLSIFLSNQHFLNCRIGTFCRLSTFGEMGFCDLFRCFFTTQIIPDSLFSIWQAYILLSRKII